MNIDVYSLLQSFPHNSHYLKRYYNFITACSKATNIDGCYTENHHILPKSMFPEYETHKSNILKLSARQHYIAHWMLKQAYPKNFKMLNAFMLMHVKTSNQKRYIIKNSKIYSDLKEEFAKQMSSRNKGKSYHTSKHSEESKLKISLSMKGNKNSPKFGTMICPWCNKSSQSIVIKRWHFDNCKFKSR